MHHILWEFCNSTLLLQAKAMALRAKSVQSLQSAIAEERGVGGDGRMLMSKMESKALGEDDCGACAQCENCCCSCWTAVMMLVCLILGFIGGAGGYYKIYCTSDLVFSVCGVVLERSGYLNHVPGLRLPPGYYPYSDKNYQNDNNRGGYLQNQGRTGNQVISRQWEQTLMFLILFFCR